MENTIENKVNEAENRSCSIKNIPKIKNWVLNHKAELGGALIGANYPWLAAKLNSLDMEYVPTIITKCLTLPAYLAHIGICLGLNKLGVSETFDNAFYDKIGVYIDLPINSALWAIGLAGTAWLAKKVYNKFKE